MSKHFDISVPTLNPEYVLQSMSEVYDWGLMDLNVPSVHKKTMGEGIKIAVIDSGKSEHFETINNTLAAKNFTQTIAVTDKNGHSTFIAGIIAAEKNNEGIVGVAPKSKLYFAKAMDDAGRGDPAALTKAIIWCVRQKVDIISISAGMFFDFKPMHKAVKDAYSKNIIIVAAAGNTGTRHYDVAFPARYPETIGVAAYDQQHQAAKFSSRGINVACAMPGVDIYSTHLGNQFCKSNGTCLTKDSLVYTPNGPISISDIKTNDLVYSFNHRTGSIDAQRVVNQWSRGIKECKEIGTKHHVIEATYNHPILVKHENKLTWKTTETIERGDLIVCASGLPDRVSTHLLQPLDHWNVELSNRIIPRRGDVKRIRADITQSSISTFLSCKHGLKLDKSLPILKFYNIPEESLKFGVGKKHPKIKLPSMDCDLAYLCGFYLGDGWITKPFSKKRNKQIGSRLCFAVCNRDEVNSKLEQTFKSVFLHELQNNRNSQYQCCNTVIADIFEQLCGYDKAKNKKIPRWIYKQNYEIIASFVSGLIDSDGWICQNGYGFASCSKHLTNGLAMLLDYVGCKRSRVKYRHRMVQAPNSHQPVSSHEYSLLFRIRASGSKINSECYNKFESYTLVDTITSTRCEKVNSVKNIGEHEIFDIEVENNHNFIANNMIVHNSFACPILAGICALILSQHRNLGEHVNTPCQTPKQMLEHLNKYAVNLGDKKSVGFGTIDTTQMFGL